MVFLLGLWLRILSFAQRFKVGFWSLGRHRVSTIEVPWTLAVSALNPKLSGRALGLCRKGPFLGVSACSSESRVQGFKV